MAAIIACTRAKPQNATEEEAYPETPEAVIRLYQSYYDQNLFEQAKTLSTAEEAKRLDELARILEAEESQDSTRLTTQFLELTCTVKGDSAICLCKLKDQYETYDTEYILVRKNSRWLVDKPKEELFMEDEEALERSLDSLFKNMQ